LCDNNKKKNKTAKNDQKKKGKKKKNTTKIKNAHLHKHTTNFNCPKDRGKDTC